MGLDDQDIGRERPASLDLRVFAPGAAYNNKNKGDWSVYEQKFLDLMRRRQIEKKVDPAVIADGRLLRSEDKPHRCHRRLVAEYLKLHWGDIEVSHIV